MSKVKKPTLNQMTYRAAFMPATKGHTYGASALQAFLQENNQKAFLKKKRKKHK